MNKVVRPFDLQIFISRDTRQRIVNSQSAKKGRGGGERAFEGYAQGERFPFLRVPFS